MKGTVSGILHAWSSPVEDLLGDMHRRFHHVELYRGANGLYHCAVEQPVAGDSRVLRSEAYGHDCAKAIRTVYEYA